MQPTQFTDAVDTIIEKGSPFDVGAYFFLKEALDFTVKRAMDNSDGDHRHVAASELLEGFRDLALQEFGPMASTMLSEWHISNCSDIGTMVFQLIQEGVFGKQDSDTQDDFVELFPLLEALDKPFLPKTTPPPPLEKRVSSPDLL